MGKNLWGIEVVNEYIRKPGVLKYRTPESESLKFSKWNASCFIFNVFLVFWALKRENLRGSVDGDVAYVG